MVAMEYAQRSPAADVINRLLKRCVECPATQPSCPPSCPDGQTCSLIPANCNACAYTTCVTIANIPGAQPAPQSSSPPIGGIVGGVIGGIAVLLGVTFAVWWFYIRQKPRDTWIPPEKSTLGRSDTFRSRRHSIASTVHTRASNVIQIAYIPGVTVRSAPDTPDMPDMPSGYSSGDSTATNTPEVEQHFFMPSRDSTWSDTTSMHSNNRISITPSLARNSVATTIYGGEDVVPPIPVQYAYAQQANMVSLDRSRAGTPDSSRMGGPTPPPMPQLPRVQELKTLNGNQVVARNLVARPVEIKKTPSGGNVPTLGNLAKRQSHMSGSSSNSRLKPTSPQFFSDEKEVVTSPSSPVDESRHLLHPSQSTDTALRSLGVSSASSTMPSDRPLSLSRRADTVSMSGSASDQSDIQAMIENAIRGAASQTFGAQHRHGLKSQDSRESGPFSDANEIKENRSPTP